ncbi:MAG: phenylalanine--tRNA ligase subunit beta, partial [Candidatus Omnitrophota bacterium]
MKISYNWLKDYLDIKIPAQQVLAKLTDAGLEVVACEQAGDDFVFEVEITANRADWLSMAGIAREVSALTNTALNKRWVALPTECSNQKRSFAIEILDIDCCTRYVGMLVQNVKIAHSPEWMQKRLNAVGKRSINNAVDITNFCLYELGQPMHVFDFDKIKGSKLIVRKAKQGEKIVTLDGVTRELDASIVVIADIEKPVAIAGIIGGMDTQVTDKTKNILLESACFDQIITRR